MSEWNQCWYCGRPVRRNIDYDGTATIDEVVPRCRGGGKMVTACKKCNNLKGESLLEEYREYLGIERFYGEEMGWDPW